MTIHAPRWGFLRTGSLRTAEEVAEEEKRTAPQPTQATGRGRMSNDDKTTKPEPTVPGVLAAHTAMFEALARLPEASRRDDRDEIHEAIGRGHRTLMEAASYREEDSSTGLDQLMATMGYQVNAAMDYTIGRIAQIPVLEPEPAASCAGVLHSAAQAWGNLGLLLDMLPGDPTPERNVIRELAHESQQAYDGWRAKQQATEEPWSTDDEKRLALAFIPSEGDTTLDDMYSKPGGES